MAESSLDVTAAFAAGCNNPLTVTIDVPAAGTVVVSTQAWIAVEHSAGTRDLLNLTTASDAGSCGVGPYGAAVDIPADYASATSFHSVSLQRPFPVTAGASTFSFNGVMQLGQSSGDAVVYANMIAVFFPD